MSNRKFLGMNSFAALTTIITVIVLGIIAVVTVMVNSRAGGTTELPSSAAKSSIIAEDGGITLSEGEVSVEVYFDPMCPFCKDYEELYVPTLQAEGLGVVAHPIAILDHLSQGTKYSTRGAASVYAVAVAAPDKVADYVKNLFAAQPAEGSTGLTTDELIAIAKQSGATITEADIKEFQPFVTGITQVTPKSERGTISTPTIMVGDKQLPPTGDVAKDIELYRAQ